MFWRCNQVEPTATVWKEWIRNMTFYHFCPLGNQEFICNVLLFNLPSSPQEIPDFATRWGTEKKCLLCRKRKIKISPRGHFYHAMTDTDGKVWFDLFSAPRRMCMFLLLQKSSLCILQKGNKTKKKTLPVIPPSVFLFFYASSRTIRTTNQTKLQKKKTLN